MALAFQDDGKIVALAAINSYEETVKDFVVFRLLPNGSLDTSFGSGEESQPILEPSVTSHTTWSFRVTARSWLWGPKTRQPMIPGG